MRKIIVLTFLTLDGVMQAPGGSTEDTADGFKYGGWVYPYFDEVSGKEMEMQMNATAALLLGRITYDIFSSYWPYHEKDWPNVNKIPKYVVSTTVKKPTWENTFLIHDVEEIKELKKSDGPDLQVHGSGKLIQTLMEHDLVDEFWLKTFPITLGTGKRLFDEGTIPAAFELFKTVVTPSGVIFAYYKRAGGVKTQDFE